MKKGYIIGFILVIVTIQVLGNGIRMTQKREEKVAYKEEWFTKYEEYVYRNELHSENTCYCLFYLDEDEIPELLVDDSGDHRSTKLVTYHAGEILESQLPCRILLLYMEKDNKIKAVHGLYGSFELNIGYIENGKYIEKVKGYIELLEGTQEEYKYSWNGEEITQEEYEERENKSFDSSKSKEVTWYDSLEEAYENRKEYIVSK